MTGSREEARALLAAALQTSPATLEDDAAIGVTLQWDSLAHMRLLLTLEERLGVRLEPEAIVSIATLADVVALLEGKVGVR